MSESTPERSAADETTVAPDPSENDPSGNHPGETDPSGNHPGETDPSGTAPGPPAAPAQAEAPWTRWDVSNPDQREAALAAAVRAVRAGECIVLPTDTVYGIGARAQDAEAVQRLLDAKHRGRDMPPPVLIADKAMAGALVEDLPEYAEALASQYWPGPLTLILTAQEGLGMDLGDTEGTIAVRVPDHEATRALLRRTGPLAVSSANVSGQPASTTIEEAIDQLGGSVSVYLDAGPTPGAAPSSIVDFTVSTAGELVRRGALDPDQLLPWAPLLVWDEPASPHETAPGETEPGETEPGETEPGETEPAQTEPELARSDGLASSHEVPDGPRRED